MKKALWPIVSGLGVALIIASMFSAYIAISSFTATIWGNFAGADSAWAITIVRIALIVGGVAALLGLATIILKAAGKKLSNARLVATVLTIIMAVAFVAIIICTIVFTGANSSILAKCVPAVSFYFMVAGLALTAIATFCANNAKK